MSWNWLYTSWDSDNELYILGLNPKSIYWSTSEVYWFYFSLFLCCRNALNVQIFIKMHRSDYAERQLRAMQQIDEDHTLTQLANAWLNLAVVCKIFHFNKTVIQKSCILWWSLLFLSNQGGSKIQEAYLIFQDFSEKYPMTVLILNGKAVCCMHMGNFDEAETLLLEALNKASLNIHKFISSCYCTFHLYSPCAAYSHLIRVLLLITWCMVVHCQIILSMHWIGASMKF